MKSVVVIGAGPAGMMAAIRASINNKVILLESNDKIGKKLFITGKGRCNVTNKKDISEFFDYIPGNPEFLYSSLYTFTNENTIEFFERLKVELKVERGGRVFPVSDKSSDIIRAFEREIRNSNVDLRLNSKVKDVIVCENKISKVILENGEEINGDHFIICTGGVSYPLTGSTGVGHKIAKKVGHKIIDLKPSLVPIETKETWVKEVQGLSLRNIELSVIVNGKTLFLDRGEMLFSHYGVTGPLVLSGSRYVKQTEKNAILSINLKPALTEEELDKRVQSDFAKYLNKDIKNALNELLPSRLINVVINESKIDQDKKVNSITKVERKALVNTIQNLKLTVKGLRPIEEAIVTAGGVSTREVNPSTMRSKVIENLSFAGEVIDVDAFTGGYNIQIALSTGYIAGENV